MRFHASMTGFMMRYFRRSSRRTSEPTESSSNCAVPVTAGERGRPRTSQAARLTRESERIRRTLPEPASVHTNSRSASTTNQTGVETAVPSRRYVANAMYLALAIQDSISGRYRRLSANCHHASASQTSTLAITCESRQSVRSQERDDVLRARKFFALLMEGDC